MGRLSDIIQNVRREGSAAREARISQYQQQKAEADVRTRNAGMRGLTEQSAARTQIAQDDYVRAQIKKNMQRIDREEELKALDLKIESQKKKLAEIVGEDTTKVYESDRATRNAYLDNMAKVDKRKATIIKDAFAKFDEYRGVGKISKMFSMPVQLAADILYKFTDSDYIKHMGVSLGEEDAAYKAAEKYLSAKMKDITQQEKFAKNLSGIESQSNIF